MPPSSKPINVTNSVREIVPAHIKEFLSGANGMGIQKLAIEKIRLDGETQPRVNMDGPAVYDYADDMKAGDKFPPIKVFYDGESYWLADGWHRLKAAKQCEFKDILADVTEGSLRDARLYAYTEANSKQGMRRTREDKKKAAKFLLLDEQWRQWSDREIARKVGYSGHATVSALRSELVASGQIDQIDTQRQFTRGGKTHSMDTSAINEGRESEPESPQRWQDHYFNRDRGDARVVFMQLPSAVMVWIAAGTHAQYVAGILGVETTYLEDQGYEMLKLVSMNDPKRVEWLEQWLDGRVDFYQEGDRELAAAAVQLDAVSVPQPDPAEVARKSIFGDTPLRSSEGFPIPGAPQRSGGDAPSNGSHSAPSHDAAATSDAPASDRTDLDRLMIKRLQSDNLKLLQDKNTLNDQIEDLTAQLATLEAQIAGTPLGLPADADPLREHLLRSLWYLDQGMASLAADRSLSQPDSLILKYCDDQSVRTTMQHYQIIERLLADDTIEAIREIAQNADQPKQAVEKALYEINKQEIGGRAR
jgi:hypothetical protein